MYNENENTTERRKGPDIWVRFIGYFKFIVWGLALFILLVVSYAKPKIETFFDRIFDVHVRETWNHDLLRKAVYLTILLFYICACAFIINSTRKKRKIHFPKRTI